MKTKNTIQIVETPIIDKYDFQENNGIINPAFLESHPEPDLNNCKSLVDSDYRQCFAPKNIGSAVQYPIDDLTIEHRPNGTSVASSWVYEFNNACSSSATTAVIPTLRRNNMSTNSLSGMYRSAYGMGYNEHMSYEMDLNRDHRKMEKADQNCVRKCWPFLVRLFVWTVIVVCLSGVFISIAFIIYIERFASESCCVEPNNTSADSLNIGLNVNLTTIGPDFDTTVGVELTSAKSGLTTHQTTVSEVEAKTTPKLTTISFFNTSTDLSEAQNNSIVEPESQESERNVTEVSTKTPETSKPVLISQTTTTTTPSTTRKITETTTTSAPTLSTMKILPKQVYSAPTSPTEQPIITSTVGTTKSAIESRVMTTNYSQTPEPALKSQNKSLDAIIGHKSEQNIMSTTSSPEEMTTPDNLIETTTRDLILHILDEIENSTDFNTTLSHESNSELNTTSFKGSDFDHTEPAINQNDRVKESTATAQPSVVNITTTTESRARG